MIQISVAFERALPQNEREIPPQLLVVGDPELFGFFLKRKQKHDWGRQLHLAER